MSTRHGGMRRQFILSPPFTATSGFETHGQMKQSDIDIDIGSAQQRDEEGRCPCHGHRSLRLGGPRARALDPETKVRHHRLDSRRPPRGSSPNLSLPSQPRNNQPQPLLIPRRTSTMSAADAKVLKTEPLVRHCLPLPRPMPHHSLRGTQAAACPSLD